VDQYQFGLLYMLLGPGHKIRPYIVGSLGFTHEDNSGKNSTRTDFSYGLGGGVKYFLTQHIGLRGDARYMPTYANSSLATYCDPFFGCFTAEVSNYQHRGNFVGGIVFRF
jgi:opacity protein-like surface antigen